MSLVSISACPICHHSQFDTSLTCTDFTASQESFTLKRCRACGFTVTDPHPDNDSSAAYYHSSKYISHTGGGKSLLDRLYVLARRGTLRWKQYLVKKNTTGKTILDVGCGTGDFLLEMKISGWNASGVEPAPFARKSAEAKTGTKIYAQTAQVAENNFDAITLWHVL